MGFYPNPKVFFVTHQRLHLTQSCNKGTEDKAADALVLLLDTQIRYLHCAVRRYESFSFLVLTKHFCGPIISGIEIQINMLK